MNWDAIGAIGELVSAVVVLITLVYLAVQIRQNTVAVAASTMDSVQSANDELNLLILNSAEVASIIARGSDEPETLDPIEQFRFISAMRVLANQGAKVLKLHRLGAVSEDEWIGHARHMAQLFGTPGGIAFREGNRSYDALYAELDRHRGDRISSFVTSNQNH